MRTLKASMQDKSRRQTENWDSRRLKWIAED
jgi:hypothetical protein